MEASRQQSIICTLFSTRTKFLRLLLLCVHFNYSDLLQAQTALANKHHIKYTGLKMMATADRNRKPFFFIVYSQGGLRFIFIPKWTKKISTFIYACITVWLVSSLSVNEKDVLGGF